MKIDVRTAKETDAAAIAALTRDLGYDTTDEETHERLTTVLGRTDHHLQVAEQSGTGVCAWLQAHATVTLESGFRVEIIGLVVSPAARRRGVGRLLVTSADNWASSIGAPGIVVRSNVVRGAAHAFYPALGYSLAKTQAVYRKTIPTG